MSPCTRMGGLTVLDRQSDVVNKNNCPELYSFCAHWKLSSRNNFCELFFLRAISLKSPELLHSNWSGKKVIPAIAFVQVFRIWFEESSATRPSSHTSAQPQNSEAWCETTTCSRAVIAYYHQQKYINRVRKDVDPHPYDQLEVKLMRSQYLSSICRYTNIIQTKGSLLQLLFYYRHTSRQFGKLYNNITAPSTDQYRSAI